MSNNTYQVLVEGGYDEIILECEYKDDYLTIRPSINYIIQSAYALKYDGIEKYAYRDDLINTSAELFLNAKFEYINIFSTIQYNGDFNFSIGASLKINELEVGVKYSLIEEYNYLIFGKGNEQFKLFIKLSN